MNASRYHALLIGFLVGLGAVRAQALTDAELAKKLTNPLAAVNTFQLKLDYDRKIGPQEKGERQTWQFKPIIPFLLGEDWMMVSRTNFFVLDQQDIFPGAGSQAGFSDIEESLFFSHSAPSASGWEWSVGPAFTLPTASSDKLGFGKWIAGPTALILKQRGRLTMGVLTKQLWSVAGDDDRSDVDKTDFQPFFAWTQGSLSYGLFLDSTYDWRREEWTLPINVTVSRIYNVGKDKHMRLLGGLRYWAAHTPYDPKGWGGRFSVTFIFPKRH